MPPFLIASITSVCNLHCAGCYARKLELFDKNRNLVPVLSIEGGQQQMDVRRGEGIYKKVQTAMQQMKERRIAFGVSFTVTSENLSEVTSDAFIAEMEETGCTKRKNIIQ